MRDSSLNRLSDSETANDVGGYDGEMKISKRAVDDLAIFGGSPMFDTPKSIGNLVKPDFEKFLSYSRIFFEAKRYSNNGPLNQVLEHRLASFHHVERCVTFSAAFWGLSLAMRCLALPTRSEVIIPSLTYRRMSEIVVSAGLIPRFCDVDENTLAQNASTVEACITEDTALILGAHPTVNCCDVAGLEKLSNDYGIPLLFDSVESAYETYRGRKVGGFGIAEGFSIHSTKLINGFEGGYITTNDIDLADRLSYMRGFGFHRQDQVVDFGMNAKLNEMHAAMALASLDDLDNQIQSNRDRYHAYAKSLENVPGIKLREFDSNEKCSYKNILVELTDKWNLERSVLLSILQAERALARPYYWPALHTKSSGFETRWSHLPVTESLSERFVLMPCGYQVSLDDVLAISGILKFISDNSLEINERFNEHEQMTLSVNRKYSGNRL